MKGTQQMNQKFNSPEATWYHQKGFRIGVCNFGKVS